MLILVVTKVGYFALFEKAVFKLETFKSSRSILALSRSSRLV